MEDDFDLDGLSKEDARAYVAEFITSLRLARTQRAEKEEEYEKWKARAKLAVERGDKDLAAAAITRAEDAGRALAAVKKDERELEFKVGELKRRLGNMQQKPELSVNADALLEQLQSVVGTDQETNEGIAEAEAEIALDALRRKMEENGEL
jgi:phage shock protein A